MLYLLQKVFFIDFREFKIKLREVHIDFGEFKVRLREVHIDFGEFKQLREVDIEREFKVKLELIIFTALFPRLVSHC